MTQFRWSYKKIGKQVVNIIENERKKQLVLKARLDEVEKRVWQAERKLEEAIAAQVELEMKYGHLKKGLWVAETGTNFSVSTQGSKP